MADFNEMEQKYLKRFGAECPYCDSPDIEGGLMEQDGQSAYQIVKCHVCCKEWYDLYTLVGIEEIEG
jgi:hypothetical protein